MNTPIAAVMSHITQLSQVLTITRTASTLELAPSQGGAPVLPGRRAIQEPGKVGCNQDHIGCHPAFLETDITKHFILILKGKRPQFIRIFGSKIQK